MTKSRFLGELREQLFGLSEMDIRSSLDFYAEIIDDRIEGGMSEADAVAASGNAADVAKEIMLSMPLPKLIKKRCSRRSALKVTEIVLLILGSPIWLSLAIAAVAVILAAHVSLWAVVLCIWAVDIVLFASFVCGVGICILSPKNALFYSGVGAIGLGGGILLFFGAMKISVLFVKLTAKLTREIKSIIIGKGKRHA